MKNGQPPESPELPGEMEFADERKEESPLPPVQTREGEPAKALVKPYRDQYFVPQLDGKKKKVPSVSTLIKPAQETGGLMYWANRVGREGLTLQEAYRLPADIGKVVHQMAQDHVAHREERQYLAEEDTVVGARAPFDAFKSWIKRDRVTILWTEVPLVSKEHEYGGRMDSLGLIADEYDGLVLYDWKTSKGVYPEMLLQLAGYAILWEENFAGRSYYMENDDARGIRENNTTLTLQAMQDEVAHLEAGRTGIEEYSVVSQWMKAAHCVPLAPLKEWHLVRFAKETGDISHHEWKNDLQPIKDAFLYLRDGYDKLAAVKDRVG